MSLKERIIEHVKKSPFRHHYMIYVVLVGAILLSIVEMLALVGEGTILQKMPDIAATSQLPHMDTIMYITMQAAIYLTLIVIVAMIAYLIFIHAAQAILIHKDMITYEESGLDKHAFNIYIYGKAALGFGVLFLILGINQQTLTLFGVFVGVLASLNLAPYIIPKSVGDKMIACGTYLKDCIAGKKEFKFY